MAKMRSTQLPPIVSREFTPETIEHGISKLQRRIEEVKNLDPNKIRYDSQEIDNLEHKIRETVREIFGENSQEYRTHQFHEIRHGPLNMMDSPATRQQHFCDGIPQSLAMLKGLVSWLEEKRLDLGVDTTQRIKTAFQGLDLHPRIASVCRKLYNDGHYANAIFDASKALMNLVKEKSGKHDLDGAPLMRTAFSKNDPILAFNDLADQSKQDEQEGMMHLFEGAALGIRNPRGHAFPIDAPERALEFIAFLSMLANLADEAKRVK